MDLISFDDVVYKNIKYDKTRKKGSYINISPDTKLVVCSDGSMKMGKDTCWFEKMNMNQDMHPIICLRAALETELENVEPHIAVIVFIVVNMIKNVKVSINDHTSTRTHTDMNSYLTTNINMSYYTNMLVTCIVCENAVFITNVDENTALRKINNSYPIEFMADYFHVVEPLYDVTNKIPSGSNLFHMLQYTEAILETCKSGVFF
ncbi:hypothetical protein MY3296_008323 [Beauveria thailandica]